MKKRIIMLLMAFVFVFVTIVIPRPADGTSAKAATAFKDLDQNEIVEAMGAGWNLGNQMEATLNTGYPSEDAWGNPVITQSFIDKVAQAGFKTIRIPVSYLNYIGSAPDYTINAAWLSRVKEVVDYAMNSGLYVIINIHGDGYSSITGSWLLPGNSDQTAIKAKYTKFWQQIGTTFADYDEHLIFESMNEVGSDANYVDSAIKAYYVNINAYNQIFVDTVRATGGNNAKRWLLVPGWNTAIYATAGDYGFVVPSDNNCTAAGKRIMVSVHYYTPWEFCGAESNAVTQWGNNADKSKSASYGGEDSLISDIQKMYTKFVAKGYPVVIGEYGSVDKTAGDSSNAAYRAYFAKRVCEVSKQNGCIPVIWDNGYNGNYGFGLFNRNSETVTQQSIIDAIMDVYSSGTTPTAAPTAVPTSTPTVTPSVTPAPTGTPTVSPAPTTTPEAGSLDVKFYGVSSDQSNTIYVRYKLTNNGSDSIKLSDLKLRYYYTKEGTADQNFYCDWSNAGSQYVSGALHALTPSKKTADQYLEISFTSDAGSIDPGHSVEVQGRLAKSDWSNYTQTNDYSYQSTASAYTSWNHVTAYQSGQLVYGVEP